MWPILRFEVVISILVRENENEWFSKKLFPLIFHLLQAKKLDENGNPDIAEYDENEDGSIDIIAYDYNQDGEWDKYERI